MTIPSLIKHKLDILDTQEPASNYGKIAWPNTHTEQGRCSSLFPLTKTVKVENTSGSLILFHFMFSLFYHFDIFIVKPWLNKLWHSLCFCIKNIDTFVKQFVQYWWFFILLFFFKNYFQWSFMYSLLKENDFLKQISHVYSASQLGFLWAVVVVIVW